MASGGMVRRSPFPTLPFPPTPRAFGFGHWGVVPNLVIAKRPHIGVIDRLPPLSCNRAWRLKNRVSVHHGSSSFPVALGKCGTGTGGRQLCHKLLDSMRWCREESTILGRDLARRAVDLSDQPRVNEKVKRDESERQGENKTGESIGERCHGNCLLGG